jgi:hypothetical protein
MVGPGGSVGTIGGIGLASRDETSESLSTRKACEWTRRSTRFGGSRKRPRRPTRKLTTGFYHRTRAE